MLKASKCYSTGPTTRNGQTNSSTMTSLLLMMKMAVSHGIVSLLFKTGTEGIECIMQSLKSWRNMLGCPQQEKLGHGWWRWSCLFQPDTSIMNGERVMSKVISFYELKKEPRFLILQLHSTQLQHLTQHFRAVLVVLQEIFLKVYPHWVLQVIFQVVFQQELPHWVLQVDYQEVHYLAQLL